MATKPDAAKSSANESAKGAPKSKKMLVIGVVVLVLALAGGGAMFFLSKKGADSEEAEVVVKKSSKGPPTFLPLDNMVVNLADPGGERVAQVGITLELEDAKAVEQVKVYLPAIRSGILLLISQRTAEEILLIEGKEKLAQDVLAEALRPFGGGAGTNANRRNAANDGPVLAVYFSSFIVQ